VWIFSGFYSFNKFRYKYNQKANHEADEQVGELYFIAIPAYLSAYVYEIMHFIACFSNG
jgi:hypothetical protein